MLDYVLHPYYLYFCSGLLVILSHGEYLNCKAVLLIHLNVTIMNVIHVVDAIASIHPGSCTGYTNLTDPWRNHAIRRADICGKPSDDRLLVNKWWRFTGIGGDRASGICEKNAGTFLFRWVVTVTYTVNESLTPTTGSAGRHHFGCHNDKISIEWVICPGGFHVFRPLGAGPVRTGFDTCENRIVYVYILPFIMYSVKIIVHTIFNDYDVCVCVSSFR